MSHIMYVYAWLTSLVEFWSLYDARAHASSCANYEPIILFLGHYTKRCCWTHYHLPTTFQINLFQVVKLLHLWPRLHMKRHQHLQHMYN